MTSKNARLLADVIGNYINDHENDSGGRTFMEHQMMCIRLLSCAESILDIYAKSLEQDHDHGEKHE